MNYACVLLPFPPPLSALTTNASKRGRVPSKRYQDWKEDAGHALNYQKPPPIDPPYRVEIAVARPDKRKRDLDNTIKPCLDILTAHGVIIDDSAVDHLTVYWATEDQARHGIRVEVKTC